MSAGWGGQHQGGWPDGQSHRDQMSTDRELAARLRAMDKGKSLMLTMQTQDFVNEGSALQTQSEAGMHLSQQGGLEASSGQASLPPREASKSAPPETRGSDRALLQKEVWPCLGCDVPC